MRRKKIVELISLMKMNVKVKLEEKPEKEESEDLKDYSDKVQKRIKKLTFST